MLDSSATISVIIPTYNRKDSLLRTLDSLRQQTYPMDKFAVIVVDDGSTDDTQVMASQTYPFKLCYVRQDNQGATAARNYGVSNSEADIVVFIDDDVTISPRALEALAEMCSQQTKVLVLGTLHWRTRGTNSVYATIVLASGGYAHRLQGEDDLSFLACNTELLACKRSDFIELGMLQDPTMGHGWPNWDDVDFGYRAHLKGFRFIQIGHPIGEHWDYYVSERLIACQRWFRASKSAVWLFDRHHELQSHIPMLYDKTPIAWGQDSLALIARKVARSFMSSQPVLETMHIVANLMERHYPSPVLLRRLYFWLQGAYMFRGYRAGLREFKLAGSQKLPYSKHA